MGETQLGIELTKAEIDSIAKFFNSLNGEMPDISYPELPAVTLKTPKPDIN